MKITAFDAPLGAEITGIDISHEINEEVFSHIKTAWLKYGVIVIREQSLSKKEQIISADPMRGHPICAGFLHCPGPILGPAASAAAPLLFYPYRAPQRRRGRI